MSWKEFLEQVAAGGEFNKGEDGEWSASSLTDAEKKVLVEILPTSNGGELTQKEVGEKLFIGLTTVKSHLDRIYDKLQVDEKGGRITKLRKKLQDKFKLWSLKELAVTQIHSSQSVQKFNWRTACQNQLDEQKQLLTSSPLRLKARSLDDVHVPLGLMERKEKERPKLTDRQEFSPEQGSEAYQQGYTEAKRVEHDAFLTEIGKRKPGEHVVILGEPGAGKTTLLMKVWEWLLLDDQLSEDVIVAWVPLAAVKSDELEDYLKKYWIKQFCKSEQIDRYWASFEKLADAGRVWLLLDGADEMGGDALGKIERTLRENWALRTRAVITCRLNLWDASATNKLLKPNFQVYRTLDFKYANPARRDEVKAFIDNWFRSTAEPIAGQKLRVALNEAGKERIKDLAQNPLRLTLLCDIWDDKKELPDTQARLYELFVDYVYRWKAREFPAAVQLRGELDAAMGDLAKQGINKPMLRFRFTGAELEKRLPSFEHRKALMDLGWLNCVGEEDRQEVFAFFHPTFQEYFAACSIDDWDYFLPRAHVDRPVPCQDEEVPTYRVFMKQWEQTILLWFGSRDINNNLNETDKEKEEFLDKLADFQAHCGGDAPPHYFLAYRIAAIGIGEFNSLQKSQLIVDQMVEFAFGRFNSETKSWQDYIEWLRDLAEAAIYLTNQTCAIKSLKSFLLNPNLGDDQRSRSVKYALDRITIKSVRNSVRKVFSPLMDVKKHNLFSKNMLTQQRISDAIAALKKPDINYNPEALYKLPSPHHTAILTLRKANGNESAIKALIDFIAQSNNHLHQFSAAEALGNIAKRNKQAIEDVIYLISNSNVNYHVCFYVFIALNEIVTESEMPLAIHNLKKYITEESQELNFDRFKYCQIIVFQYAQALSYPTFYDAWHITVPN